MREEQLSRIAVIGTGAWGTVLAALLARSGAQVCLVARQEAEAEAITTARENCRFLPGVALPASLQVSAAAERALAQAALVILAVPAQRLRQNVEQYGAAFAPEATVLCASKGLELGSGLTPSQVIAAGLGEPHAAVLSLSGPNLSAEIAAGLPAAAVVAGPPAAAEQASAVQRLFPGEALRLYTSDDQAGVELAGALKNVIAIACGIGDGLAYGHNARAALVTRGLAEMTRLTVAAGGRAGTVAGLAGLGDLMTTISGTSSRNYSLGLALGRGAALTELLASGVHVVEGVPTTAAALSLAARLGVELPITTALNAVLTGGVTPSEAASALLRRSLVSE